MKALLVFCCLFAACMGFPPLKKQSSVPETTNPMQIAVEAIHRQNGIKRGLTNHQAQVFAFMKTDLDEDGHITACEWAAYYSLSDLPGLPELSYNNWKRAFEIQMNSPGFDTNNNDKMELNEYLNI